MPRSRRHAVPPAVVLAILTGACGYDITTREMQTSGTVATYRAPGTSFGAYASFAMVDKVGLVTDASPAPPYVSAPSLLALVASSLEARGFVRAPDVDPTSPPPSPPADLGVNVTALEATQSAAAYWTGYGGYWGPATWGYPGYSYAYPWDWVPIAPKTGTLLVEVADLRNAAAGEVEVVWAAIGYQVSAGSGGYDSVSALESVNQAFAQSPYLLAGPGGAP